MRMSRARGTTPEPPLETSPPERNGRRGCLERGGLRPSHRSRHPHQNEMDDEDVSSAGDYARATARDIPTRTKWKTRMSRARGTTPEPPLETSPPERNGRRGCLER